MRDEKIDELLKTIETYHDALMRIYNFDESTGSEPKAAAIAHEALKSSKIVDSFEPFGD